MSPSQLQLNLSDGSVIFSFTPEAARTLQAAIAELMDRLKVLAMPKAKETSTKPTPQPPLEYRYSGEIFLEVFCNPNIWASPFAAKVLITVRDDRIRVNTEADLTQIIADLNAYLEQFQ